MLTVVTSNLTLQQWILVFAGVWVFAIVWGVITNRLAKKSKLAEILHVLGIAGLSFLAGLVAVGLVNVGLHTDMDALFMFLFLAAGGVVAFTAYKLSKMITGYTVGG